MSESTRLPSTLNSTRETPTLSEAVAASATLPVTVAPDAGAVIETEGWWCRGVGPRHAHARDRLLPAASYAVAVIVWDPTEALVASQVAA